MGEIKQALMFAAGLCILFGTFWLFRARTVGPRGYAMAGAFCLMAVLCYGYGQQWPQLALAAMLAVTLVLLVIDFALRAGERVDKQ